MTAGVETHLIADPSSGNPDRIKIACPPEARTGMSACHFVIPAKECQPCHFRHSSESRNPVVDFIHSRQAGMTTHGGSRQAHPRNPPDIPARLPRPLVPDAGYHLDRSFQTRSTTYIPVGVHPCRRRPLVPDAALPPASLQAWIPACAGMTAGVETHLITDPSSGNPDRIKIACPLQARTGMSACHFVMPAKAGIQWLISY